MAGCRAITGVSAEVFAEVFAEDSVIASSACIFIQFFENDKPKI